jgi:folylpolyglutamate synthase/dihydropteroate synthase
VEAQHRYEHLTSHFYAGSPYVTTNALRVDLSAADSEHGVRSIPLIDTDALNSNLALLTLHLLQKHRPHALPQLDLQSAATARGLDARPPCRWEEHTYTDPASGVVVDVVLDMGHNPAALAALARRIAHKFPGREVRYATHADGYCSQTCFASFRHCGREIKFLLRVRCA